MADIDISKILDFVVEVEKKAAATYRDFAHKVEALKPTMFYTPHQNKISWNEEVGFYKDLEEKILGPGSASGFYQSLPTKVEKDHSLNFYKSLGDRYTDDVKGIFLVMADEEEKHAETFRELLVNTNNGDENKSFKKDVLEYIKNHSDEVTVTTTMNGPSTILKALEEAVSLEQSAVKFYTGMIPFANPGASEILDTIIKEERKHEARLKSQIKNYKLLIEQH